MSDQFLASKVITTESEPSVRTLPALPTAVLSVVGISERGPLGVSTLCTSFEEFVRLFGGDFANSQAVHQVRAFFKGGGQFLYFTRTCHYTDVATPATATATKGTLMLLTAATGPTAGVVTGSVAGPWDLEPGDTLIVEVDGAAFSGTATFNATAALRECTNAEVYALVTGQNLTVKIDRGTVQTVAFLTGEFVDIANATAEEVAAVLNVKLVGASASATSGGTKVTITSDKRGKGSYVEVTGGTANVAIGFNVAEVNGTGSSDLLDIDAVTAAEAKLVIEAAGTLPGNVVVSEAPGGFLRLTSATTGVLSDVLVTAASTADDECGLDNVTHSGGTGAAVDTLKVDGKTPGGFTDDIYVRVSAAASGEATEFDLAFEKGGVVIEKWSNLTMTDAAARFAETIVNHDTAGSRYLAVTDQDAVVAQRPVNGLFGPLTGGADGLGAIADIDFIGSVVGKTGLYAMDLTPAVTLLAVPDRATAAVHQGMYGYSENVTGKRIFCIWDPPAGMTASAIKAYFVTTAALYEATECGALAWPRVKVTNPNRTVYGNEDTLVVCNSGHWAARMAKNDNRPGGLYEQPAGIDYGKFDSVVGVETDEVLDEGKRDLLYPVNINPIWSYTGSGGFIVDGGRCAKGTGNFPFIAPRRGASYIEQTMKAGIQFARHRNNNRTLRARCDRTLRMFLLQQMGLNAFASQDPASAFYLDFDVAGIGLNNAVVQYARQLKARIGLAFSTPAEFVWIDFSADLRAIEAALFSEAA